MKEIEIEERITELEVRAILKRLFEMGEGDIIMGSIKGIEAGIIDSPFSPNVNLKGNVLGIKDSTGACRYLDFGMLPIPKESQEFHREKLAERERAEKRKMDYNVSIEDFWAFSKGKLIGMPSPN
jgi:methylaspartate mutase epsilon subunit